MKKLIFIFILMMLPAVSIFAEEKAPRSSKAQGETLVGGNGSLDSSNQALIGMDSTVSRINQLERRLNDMERELRDQRDRTRYLERDVNDLKRRSNNSAY